MRHTENLNLPLFDGTDKLKITPSSDSLNSAMEIIDSKIKDIEDDIPTSLKNPYSLTINGTVYDGSEAKEVTVSGGSSGWCLIDSVTITEEIKEAILDFDSSYNEHCIIWKVEKTSTNTSSTNPSVYFGKNNIYENYNYYTIGGFAFNSATRTAVIHIFKTNDMMVAEKHTYNGDLFVKNYNAGRIDSGASSLPLDDYNCLKFTSSCFMGIGSKIEIYGR